jgi:H+/gluconate symporter-like permease
MNPFIFVAIVLLTFVGSVIGWLLFFYRSGRIYRSPKADRSEKNKRHLVTAVVAVFCLASVAVCSLLPAAYQPIAWFSAGIMMLLVLPVRVIFTELGLRRRAKSRPT